MPSQAQADRRVINARKAGYTVIPSHLATASCQLVSKFAIKDSSSFNQQHTTLSTYFTPQHTEAYVIWPTFKWYSHLGYSSSVSKSFLCTVFPLVHTERREKVINLSLVKAKSIGSRTPGIQPAALLSVFLNTRCNIVLIDTFGSDSLSIRHLGGIRKVQTVGCVFVLWISDQVGDRIYLQLEFCR
jgi:hypothetical protein